MELFKIENLSFSYPDAHAKALDRLSLTVNEGEFVVLCGLSGCGKTTLLRLLKRELAPHGEQSGEIAYFGNALSGLSDRVAASEIGFVMQNPEHQVVTDKVWHELAFGLESLGFSNDEIRRRVGEMTGFMGIGGWFDKKVSDLSGGQKQLLCLASVMAMQPKVLLLDEPTSRLDPIAASEFISMLHKLNRDLGVTVVLAEHRLEELFPVADRIAVLHQGKISLCDTPALIGSHIGQSENLERMMAAMPGAVRIYNGLSFKEECPITVKEGRVFLNRHYAKAQHRRLETSASNLSKEPVLETSEVWFRYERNLPDVLKGCFLSVYSGEILAVFGENGSGKSTLLRVLSGQERPYRGKISLRGKKLREYSNPELYRRNIAYLPQDPQSVFLKSTVKEDLNETCTAMGYSPETAQQNIERLTVQLEIDSLSDRHPYDLSGGEQQRAALCKVLLQEPQILMLDEPTKGIDAFSKETLIEILRNLKRNGMTVVLVTHDVEFAAACADRCVLLFNGAPAGEGTPKEFLSSNAFYTTAASRISRTVYENAVTVEDVIALCQKNGVPQTYER